LGDYLVADEERNQKKIFVAKHRTVVPDRNATGSLTDVADQALPQACGPPARARPPCFDGLIQALLYSGDEIVAL
jgi:hypothetical protein